MRIIDILNKIKWDKTEKPEETYVFYFDRMAKKLVKIEFSEMKEIGRNFMAIDRNGEEVEIPLHRMRVVRRDKVLLWAR